MNINIIIDSTVDVDPALKSQFTVVPLTVHFGDKEYLDGVTIDHKRFYELLVECDELPSTSQATPGVFEPVFQQVADRGESAVVLTLASQMSGTYQSACIAASEFENIYVVDTRSVSVGSGILAELALELRDQGLSAGDIAQQLEQIRSRGRVIALVDTLEYLKKGGRISKTAALAGGLLNIKPVLSMVDGEIKILGKARGSRQGNNLLVEEIRKAGGVDFSKPILLGYTGLSDALLVKYREDSHSLWEQGNRPLPSSPIGSVIGTHVGPGAIAAAFFTNE